MKKIFLLLIVFISMVAVCCSQNNYTPQLCGHTAVSPTITTSAYKLNGEVCHYEFKMTAVTSNSIEYWHTLPFPAKYAHSVVADLCTDNGAGVTTSVRIDFTAGSNVVRLYKAPAGTAWTASGSKGTIYSIDYIVSTTTPKDIIFVGNSLWNLHSGTLTANGHYGARKIYSNITATDPNWNAVLLAINGNPTTTINNDFTTQVAPHIDSGDVVAIFEITNDLSVNGLTGQQAYDQLVEFSDSVDAHGGLCVVVTFIARNGSSDASDLFDRGQACNTLIMADTTHFYRKTDLGSTATNNEKTDANNTTYFQSDKIHKTTTGTDTDATFIHSDWQTAGFID